jgi:hypothetical protein
MAILVKCGKCQAEFRARDDQAGKRGRCPKCSGPIEVPAGPPAAAVPARAGPAAVAQPAKPVSPATAARPARAAAPAVIAATPARPKSREQLQAEILAALSGQIAPARVSWTYGLAALLVALVMVLLPLLYVALIALVAMAMYYHAVHDVGIFAMGHGGRGGLMMLLIYAGPLVAGVILIFFMFKPLLARPAKSDRGRSLGRPAEPLLFAFVERICALVGAPAPKRIDVNCEVNASASFRRGWLSLLMPADLVLTIGMPLAAGLSLRQFAGVLAHEFGHFTQGAGMRLTYLIRSISWWLTRVVYERDAWDAGLEHWAANSDWRIGLILHLARLCVWLTRRVLWVLMVVGHGVAGVMLRQMEFDADRAEARLAGSETFEATCRRVTVLGVATQGALADLAEFYRDGRLGDNFPKLILANVAQLPAAARAEIDKAIDHSRTGWLDTHPADSARIAAAHREHAPGVFACDAPATVLFADFDALARNTTWDYYRSLLGAAQLKPSDLRPVDDLLAEQVGDAETAKAGNRFFQGATFALRPLPLAVEQLAAPADVAQTARDLKLARSQMLAAKPDFDQAFPAFDEADTHILHAQQATALAKAGLRLDAAAFSRPIASAAAAETVRAEAAARQQQLDARLSAFEQAAARRLTAALELLQAPGLAGKLPDAQRHRCQAARLLPAIALLNRTFAAVIDVRNHQAELAAILNRFQGHERDEKLLAALNRHIGLLADRLVRLRGQLVPGAYPFDHARGEMTLGAYLIPEMQRDDPGAVFNAAGALGHKWPILYGRCLSSLALVAETVEAACGLAPLPDPPKAEP